MLIFPQWHEAKRIILRMPDNTILDGPGRWQTEEPLVTVEMDGSLYTTHWNNVLIVSKMDGSLYTTHWNNVLIVSNKTELSFTAVLTTAASLATATVEPSVASPTTT